MSQPRAASKTDYLKGIISCKLHIDALVINRSVFCVVIICSYFSGTHIVLVWGSRSAVCRACADCKVRVRVRGRPVWLDDILLGTINLLFV